MDLLEVKPYDIKDWARCYRDENGEVALRPEWLTGDRKFYADMGYKKCLRASHDGEQLQCGLSWSEYERIGRTPDSEINWDEVRDKVKYYTNVPWRKDMQSERDAIRLG